MTLTVIERHRLEKLIWLYHIEFADEDDGSPRGGGLPSAVDVSNTFAQQGVDVDIETMQSILGGKLAISDELAAMIEEAFIMPAGWLSN